jgi:RNase adaptor protein for sRNA GlmZ degradation
MPEVDEFWEHVRGLVDNSVGVYLLRGFSSLTVWFGCTGGQHRSVYFANRLADHLRRCFPSVNVAVTHREEGSWPANRAPAAELPEPVAAAS